MATTSSTLHAASCSDAWGRGGGTSGEPACLALTDNPDERRLLEDRLSGDPQSGSDRSSGPT